MSAFIVTDKTIAACVHAIQNHLNEHHKHTFGGINQFDSDPDILGQALVDLNYMAVNARYHEKDVSHKYNYKPSWSVYGLTDIQKYKALQCLIYQCSEDKAVDTELYKALVDLKQELAGKIIYQMTEYQKAEWDLAA